MKDPVSISKAGKDLGVDRRTIRGLAIGMGLRLMPIGTALNMSRADYERLRRRLEQSRADEAVTVSS